MRTTFNARVPRCASRVWKKLSPQQRKTWRALAKSAEIEVSCFAELIARNLGNMAHNIICNSVWQEPGQTGKGK